MEGKGQTFTLRKGPAGIELCISAWGACVTSLKVPLKDGSCKDVVLGYQQPADGTNEGYIGFSVGRIANRIAAGKFTLDGTNYQLQTNNGPNHLHGGVKGFDKVYWKMEELTDTSVKLSYISRDGEEGYPGALSASVTYSVTEDEVTLVYMATTDARTIVNLSNHTYFNLKGSGDILGHQMTINAPHYTPVDAHSIPTGEIAPVMGTVFDFTTAHVIGDRISDVSGGMGYDHNYCMKTELQRYYGQELWPCARCEEPETGLCMEVSTNQPGVQFYTGNYLDSSVVLKGGQTSCKHAGFCLETQTFPDAINQLNFPSPVLSPGDTYHSITKWKFVK